MTGNLKTPLTDRAEFVATALRIVTARPPDTDQMIAADEKINKKLTELIDELAPPEPDALEEAGKGGQAEIRPRSNPSARSSTHPQHETRRRCRSPAAVHGSSTPSRPLKFDACSTFSEVHAPPS